MKNIVHLCMGFFCDDSILRCVGENCHLIEYLDIEDSDVTDEGLMYLIPSENSAGCPKLQELILGENKYRIEISPHTVALLLKSLPDIVKIIVGDIKPALLEMFDTVESQKYPVLKLKSLKLYIDVKAGPTLEREIIILSKLCLNLEHLEIMFTEARDVLALKHFACLSQLHVKYLEYEIFPIAEFKQYLKEYCKQITSLEISCCVLDSTCFSILGKHCPSLKNLWIQCKGLVESEPINIDEENNLKILSTFTLIAHFVDDSILVMRDLLYSILKSTNRLTKVRLELPVLRHQDVRFLLDVVDTYLLHSLIIRKSNVFYPCFDLTMESVYLILEKCPLLNTLGYLEYWDVVSSDVEKLKKDMEYSNYDIEICL